MALVSAMKGENLADVLRKLEKIVAITNPEDVVPPVVVLEDEEIRLRGVDVAVEQDHTGELVSGR